MSHYYYFSEWENFDSIIRNGILSNYLVFKKNISRFDFSNQSVQKRRHFKKIKSEKHSKEFWLHEFVPLYYITKTPTLYAVKNLQEYIFFIEVNNEIIRKEEKIVFFTDGNAASNSTKFFENFKEAIESIDWNILNANYWNEYKDGIRKRSSEVLIYRNVEPIYFNKIIVNNQNLFNYLKQKLDKMKWNGLNENFKLILDPNYFF